MTWLMLTAGVEPEAVRGSYTETDVRVAERVRKLPKSAQRRWFHRNSETLRACERQPDLDPAHYDPAHYDSAHYASAQADLRGAS